MWNLTSQAPIAARPLTGIVSGRSVAFSPDGATLATGGDDGNVRLWAPRWSRQAATAPPGAGT